ncbi:IPT/TIG domain-containing protein [Candidatus Cyanaurora vandensis]|uniref:IPT/TIG domain-containing protein n=1 Tax=Candidatus Cyanaurora vandensis TaxID=2714958 RepID=UPI00257C1548|nr:IPT/TIG domain-containing protein [Candidatus Cyanaurora vandensis]
MTKISPAAGSPRWFKVLMCSLLAAALMPLVQAQVTPTVFINELHYDNTGADVNEGVELAGTAGTSLTGWSLVLYNGGDGTAYNTKNLTGTIPNQQNGYGTVYFSYTNSTGSGTAIQNGAPDGVALINSSGTVVQFLSYEGTFTAVGGAANGQTSTAMTTSEPGTGAVGRSLQLSGTGTSYSNFTWASPQVNTNGLVNTGQSFTSGTPTATKIRDIQGSAHTSPKVGQAVTGVAGIVTGVRAKSFYIQDPSPDSNLATSEGINVYVNALPTVVVGDSVIVSGTVAEYLPSGDTTSLSVTQISTPTVTKISGSNPLPTPIVIGTGGRVPPTAVIDNDNLTTFDVTTDGIDFYESLEGMRVQVNNPVAVGPTSQFGDIVTLPDNGANAGVRTNRGGIVIQATDFNPERIYISSDIVTGAPQVNVGDRFSGAIAGVLDYSFSNFKLLNTSPLPTPISAGLTQEATTLIGTSNQLTVAGMNVENMYPGSLTDVGDLKSTKLAEILVNKLKNPDILSLEEIQDNNGPTNDTVVDANLTLTEFINAITAAGGPAYQYAQINPVDDQDGGQPGGNIRVAFLYNPARVTFVSRPGGTATTATTVSGAGNPQLSFSPGRVDPTNSAFASSRKPLVGEFLFNSQKVFVIGNHFNSKGGDNPLYGKNQPPVLSSATQRTQQAQAVNSFVNSIVSLDANAKVVVLGDINDFEFSGPMTTLKGTILTDLTDNLAQAERYTYNYEGNAQALDHILVTNPLVSASTLDIVHVNSEFSNQVSDHDPEVVRITINASVAAPTITSFTPTSGAVGTSVTITGTNFTGATAVKFNTTNATSFTVNSASQITAVIPTGATTGTISVTTSAGTVASTGNFTVTTTAQPPTITSFTPASGPVGTNVTVNGTNFTGTSAVKFNGTSAASFAVNSATQIAATVPTGATTGAVSVTTGAGTATSSTNFTVSTTSSQLLVNPGFENGSNPAPWVATAGIIDNSASPAARTGSWKAWLNGYGTTRTDTLAQTVTIPTSVTSATLSLYLQITTAETTTTNAYDKLQVQVRNTNGTVLATLGTYSNLNKSTTYLQRTFSLTPYKGQTIQVYFLGTEDSSLQTSFLIDDTSLTTQ